MVLKRLIVILFFLSATQQLFAQRILSINKFEFAISNKKYSFTKTESIDSFIVDCGNGPRTQFVSGNRGWEPANAINEIEIKGHFLPYLISSGSLRCDSLYKPLDDCGLTMTALPKDCYSVDTLVYPKRMFAILVDTIRHDGVKKFIDDFDKLSLTRDGYDYRFNPVKFWIVNINGVVKQYSGDFLPSYFTDEIEDVQPGAYLILRLDNDITFCWYFL